jgi:hypothetical protein
MAMDTITDLLAAVDLLPDPDRSEARERIAAALAQPAPAARLALGTLALDLLDPTPTARPGVPAARPA